ncbi:hypothetical protein IW262DRAFT_1297415 [Armillaria fumosa]|nr:hypothetical protein IW262DRAFT_1297415 [Armillaria fumosa]
MEQTELWLEFKKMASAYGFKDDDRKEWVSQIDASKKCQSQLGTYAANTLNTQHRRHLFSLNLGPEDGKYLVEFLHRFSTMADGDRGLDETVTMATKEGLSLVEPLRVLAPWTHPYNKHQREFVKILVPEGDGVQEIVAGPALAWLYNISISSKTVGGMPVFLKSDILRTLNKAKVRSVPTLVCGGDSVVRGQTTTSHEYINSPWNRTHGARLSFPQCTRQRQRTLTEEVWYPLRKFKSSKQLTRIVYDAFLAAGILIVYDSDGKVPEDIHGGGRGLLSDWDMTIHVDELDMPARQAERKGTWPSMSMAPLDQTPKKHEPRDEFESSIYVMLYHGLRYLPHNEVGPGLKNLLSFIFDLSIELGNGQYCGGPTKCSLVHSLKPLRPDFRFGCSPFNIWIRQMLSATDQWQMVRTQQTALPQDTPFRLVEPTRVIDLEKAVFYDHSGLEAIWKKVLEMDGWPTDNEAAYQLEPSGTKRSSEDSNRRAQKKHKSGCSAPAAASDTTAP